MDYVNFGRAGVKVSRLALGLGFRGQRDEGDMQRVIERAVDLGINLIDCANVYGPMDDRKYTGHSEVVLGKAIKSKRDDVVITSKVTSPIGHGPNDSGSSRYHIMREIERSLQRIDTDHIDVYLLHRYDDSTPLDETLRALDDLLRAGKTRYVGCCNFQAWQVVKSLDLQRQLNALPFITVQNPYSLVDRRLEGEMFPMVRDYALGVMAYSPLGVGLLSGIYTPGKAPPKDTLWGRRPRERFDAVMNSGAAKVMHTAKQVAGEYGKSIAQIALAWVLSHPEITVAITGGDTVAHLEDNAGAASFKLDPEARKRLDAVSAGMQGFVS
ncbi:MAG: aldo/keto reductase [Chloroflexi bacterium]|nr:aldo/keto reductase [Chloroflexota bacterium]